jgi:hypothetical protein
LAVLLDDVFELELSLLEFGLLFFKFVVVGLDEGLGFVELLFEFGDGLDLLVGFVEGGEFFVGFLVR